ncbi:MAG: Trm112 family protein [Xanthomonadales bacterium]|nr:Trm112 family protein [Xanthomonadales bacterium]
MPVDGKLLEILCCPVSKTPLRHLEKSRLEKLNRAIEAGEVKTVRGEPVGEPLREALVTEDSKVIYPIVDDVPVLLEERGIGTTQLQDF